jgi:hypothetical protein
MGLGGRGSRVARFTAAALTSVAGIGLFASGALSNTYLPLVPSTQAPGATDDAGPCTHDGAIGASSVPLASYRFECVGGQWLLTSLDSAGSKKTDGTVTTDSLGNRFVSTDGVWVPQGAPRIPPIKVVTP